MLGLAVKPLQTSLGPQFGELPKKFPSPFATTMVGLGGYTYDVTVDVALTVESVWRKMSIHGIGKRDWMRDSLAQSS